MFSAFNFRQRSLRVSLDVWMDKEKAGKEHQTSLLVVLTVHSMRSFGMTKKENVSSKKNMFLVVDYYYEMV